MARVLVGVTGGIAAYKACDLVRLLVKGGHEVVPLVTPGADQFVRADTFFALARRSPAEDLYVHLTRADLLVVAPLTTTLMGSVPVRNSGIASAIVSFFNTRSVTYVLLYFLLERTRLGAMIRAGVDDRLTALRGARRFERR